MTTLMTTPYRPVLLQRRLLTVHAQASGITKPQCNWRQQTAYIAKPSMPLRISVRPQASHTQDPRFNSAYSRAYALLNCRRQRFDTRKRRARHTAAVADAVGRPQEAAPVSWGTGDERGRPRDQGEGWAR